MVRPPRMDVDQWMQAYKAMGAKEVVFTAKHHDGFVLYPTRYSPHSVIASPWWIRTEGCADAANVQAARERAQSQRGDGLGDAFWQVRDAGCANPQGDVLGTYIRAARAAGLRIGVYLSPSDGSELPHQWHEWSVVPATADPSTAHNEGIIPGGAQAGDIGSRTVLADPSVRYLQWFPAEADVSIRPGWFFHPSEQPKSASQLTTIYRTSVGRNALLLLNVPPGPDGRIAQADVDSLTAFGDAVRATYADNLLAPAVPSLTDDRLDTAWSPKGTTGTLELTLPGQRTFDQIRLGEAITHGQQVEGFAVDRWDGSGWIRMTAGTTIGYSRILTLSPAGHHGPHPRDHRAGALDASPRVPRPLPQPLQLTLNKPGWSPVYVWLTRPS